VWVEVLKGPVGSAEIGSGVISFFPDADILIDIIGPVQAHGEIGREVKVIILGVRGRRNAGRRAGKPAEIIKGSIGEFKADFDIASVGPERVIVVIINRGRNFPGDFIDRTRQRWWPLGSQRSKSLGSWYRVARGSR
jgi:hypothetical protein